MPSSKQGNILGLITARGGSKRLPGKNLRHLDGKPLIYYVIKAANESGKISRLIVSTDDDEIASVSESYGAEVLFKRPADLAEDDTPSYKVLQHAFSHMLEKEKFDSSFIVLLQPTAPLVQTEDIDRSISICKDNDDYDLVAAACPLLSHAVFYLKGDKYLRPVQGEGGDISTQEKYMLAGSVYVYRSSIISSLNSSLPDRSACCLVDPRYVVDIDTKEDFELAEQMVKKMKRGRL